MSRKPWKIRAAIPKLRLADVLYLSDAPTPAADDPELDRWTLWCLRHGFRGFDGTPKPRDLWARYGAEFLPAYVKAHPCQRPLPWWQWDSPRCDTGTGAWFEPLPVPRRRIGGTGQTEVEKWPATVPTFDRGIPSFAEIDPADPPTFEAEAEFLRRHDLLTPTEQRWLAGHPELLAPEAIVFDDDADEPNSRVEESNSPRSDC